MTSAGISCVLSRALSPLLLSMWLCSSLGCGSSAVPAGGRDGGTLPEQPDAASGQDARADLDGSSPAASEAGSKDSGSDPGAASDSGSSDSGSRESDSGMASLPTCPPPAVSADEFIVFGDSYAIGASGFGFSGPLEISQAMVCGGTSSLHYAANQYDGFGIATPPVAASVLEARVYVSRHSAWTISAQPSAQDNAHCFRLPNSTLCGQFDPACGENQDASSCILQLEQGFQRVRLSVPDTTPQVAVIMFEQQSEAPTPTDIYVDELRLVRR